MTEITLNQNRFVFKDTAVLNTVEDLYRLVLQDERFKEYAVTGLKLDQTQVDPYATELRGIFINELTSIDLELKSALEIAQNSLSDLPAHADEVIDQIRLLTAALTKNDFDLVNQQFAQTIEVVDLFTQLSSKVVKTLRKNYHFSEKLNGNIRNIELHLLSVLKSLLPAKEKNDVIMMSDLLEYELVENFNQWKNELVPQIKEVATL